MPAKRGQLRIITGKWRGRKINFVDRPQLRPTSDRIRETLFNWLQPYVQNANCLDLFAGSGALSFEALSRGAKHAVMIDRDPQVITALKMNIEKLAAAEQVTLIQTDPLTQPIKLAQTFDLVFLDPPFQQKLLAPSIAWLIDNNLLAQHSKIYIEAEKNLLELPIPAKWHIMRDNIAGDVRYSLIDVI